jgi:hypothetical protein
MPRVRDPRYIRYLFLGTERAMERWARANRSTLDRLTPHEAVLVIHEPADMASTSFAIDRETIVVENLPAAWPHWHTLRTWMETVQGGMGNLHQSWDRALRRARTLDGVAIPERAASGEAPTGLILDDAEEPLVPFYHTVFIGTRHEFQTYQRNNPTVLRELMLFAATPGSLRATDRIGPMTRVVTGSQLPSRLVQWQDTVRQLWATRVSPHHGDWHGSVNSFLRLGTVTELVDEDEEDDEPVVPQPYDAVFVGPMDAYRRWREERVQRGTRVLRVSSPTMFRTLPVNFRTQIIHTGLETHTERRLAEWREAVRVRWSEVIGTQSAWHPSVTQFVGRCETLIQSLRTVGSMQGGAGGVIPVQSTQALEARIRELETENRRLIQRLENLRATHQAILNHRESSLAERTVAGHTLARDIGNVVLWCAARPDETDRYKLIRLNNEGSDTGLMMSWIDGAWTARPHGSDDDGDHYEVQLVTLP